MRRIRTKTLRRGKRAAAIAMSALLVAAPVAALADGLYVDDGGTVTNNTDIMTTDYFDDGIAADNSSTVTQNGNVTTTGDDAYGIYADEESEVTVNGNVTTSGEESVGVDAEGSSTVTVNGNVSTSGEDADGVDATNYSIVNVLGNVILSGEDGYGVWAEDYSTVTVGGNVITSGEEAYGVAAADSSTVTVGGNVTTLADYAWAVVATYNSSITVNGNVSTSGDEASALYGTESSSLYVGGNVTAEKADAIVVATGTIVTVLGDVTGGESGIYIDASEDPDNQGTIVVEGTIAGVGSAINIYGEQGSDVSKLVVPVIVTSGLESDGDLFGYSTRSSGQYIDKADLPDEVENALVAAVYYIVNADGFTTNADTIEANGSEYLVKQEGDTLTLTLATPDGYELDAIDWGEYVTTVVDNGDGTYTITVERGGNLTFSATYKPVASDDGASDDGATDDGASSTVRTASVTTATATAIPSTGDASAAPVLLVSLAGIALCGTGALARRRQRG